MVAMTAGTQNDITRYVRFQDNGTTSYGILHDDGNISVLAGDLFGTPGAAATGKTVKLASVKLLAPCAPKKVLAVGLNYKSHLGTRTVGAEPGLFAKLTTCIAGPDDSIICPPDAKNLHYEGELVLIIGKQGRNIPAASALDHVFGVTAGNDVSERDWQKSDLQWFRAKGSDTFGPIGPAIVSGLNYGDLLLQTRLNGEVVQSQRTSDFIFNIATMVSYISNYVTLEPGDVIFTGTPGSTKAMKPGDVVEVELEGVGILRNPIAS